jgi:catechol 2,3-dioxygenase-like lactoylglutathione lyase family enzyme
MELEGIDHVAVGGRDIERSAQWYIEVLGFERLHEGTVCRLLSAKVSLDGTLQSISYPYEGKAIKRLHGGNCAESFGI